MYTLSQNFADYIQKVELAGQTSYPMQEVLNTLSKKGTLLTDIEAILVKHGIMDISYMKIEAIDFLISYAHYILEDDVISNAENYDFTALKRIFRIKEGDFYINRNEEIKEILQKEFLRIFSDKYVDRREELEEVDLQGLFNLSYDQFEDIKSEEVISALLSGANPKDLNIAKLPKGFKIK
ncbi:hypothetical protein [Sphingobacterium paucimobilis]|uniref:Uncharacterized protein n=1 Tax=Sphingobacterium paucimobilis HER1398 TaxID=1346330 RepID=U2HU62_9SPHI|nr:hypothetical protein [Sphingobacterium paucimobilis]ERJ59032.1 hypothetical protein M472_09640 [Sphingobacterium paucimobilis HER1398]